MFAIAWEYLTGRAVATDPTDRTMAEWPPHPDRVFQALVAAWGERGEDDAERKALAWLAGLGAPQVAAPAEAEEGEGGSAGRCCVSKVFVPVNDLEGPRRGGYSEKSLALLPANRTRKERYFPAIHVGRAVCALCWPSTEAVEAVVHLAALGRLCASVSHIGHSSSLVRMWLPSAWPGTSADDEGTAALWVPCGERERRDISMRVADSQRLDALVAAFAGGGEDWRRPPTARWQGYRQRRPDEAVRHQGHFDERLIVLRQVDGPRLHLPQTLLLAESVHKTLLKASDGWTPESVSGHTADGTPTKQNHLAILPLAHVGPEYADGHLLGLALALPRDLTWEAEGAIYRAIACAMDQADGSLRLLLGPLGVVKLVVEDRPAPPFSLRPFTWCRPARRWGTVTPIVLDRLPPRRVKDNAAWAAEQIATACRRQGLPEPAGIVPQPVSPCLGAPAARDFRPLVKKDGIRRWHFHATLTFAEPVSGPLLLGAGRFRGYGLFRPLPQEEQL